MIHEKQHPLAGKKVGVIETFGHRQFPDLDHIIIEDWWDRVSGRSWMDAVGNPACLIYAMRSATCEHSVPFDDDVMYGKYKGMGVLVHMSEIVILENETSQ